MKLAHIVTLAALAFPGCPTPAPTPPLPDVVSDGAPLASCAAACSALRWAGCSIGGQADCADFMTDIDTHPELSNAETHKPLHCVDVATVHTKDDARRLGFACP